MFILVLYTPAYEADVSKYDCTLSTTLGPTSQQLPSYVDLVHRAKCKKEQVLLMYCYPVVCVVIASRLLLFYVIVFVIVEVDKRSLRYASLVY